MKIFVSWSGERSKAVAAATAEWLKNVIHILHPWMSEAIPPGEKWSQVIGSKLGEAKCGIICATPENVDAPWLVFEAGALSNRFGDPRVVPILLDMNPSDLQGPLAQFQAIAINKEKMSALAFSINEQLGATKLEQDVLKKSLNSNWRDFAAKVEKAAAIPLKATTLRSIVKALRKHGLPEPSVGRSLNFKEGFETHSLYDTAFSLAKNRLYIFGRKNRKAFDKEHDDFFKRLPAKISKGFDFKCLFLDPKAPPEVIKEAHADRNFLLQLKQGLSTAKSRLRKHGIDPATICRMYSIHRPHELVVIDELVLFAPTGLDAEGCPKGLTKCPFKIVDVSDSQGNEFLNHFISVWDHSRVIAT
jgi:hypothetical protein